MYSFNKNYLGNGWGFYIDLENLNPGEINTDVKHFENEFNNDFYNEYYEDMYDEYEYYTKDLNNDKNETKDETNIITKDKKNITNLIIRVSSTTFVTVALTYIILFVL